MMMTNNTSTSTFIKIVVANLMVAALLATYMCSNDSGVGLKGSRKLQTTNPFFTIGPGKPPTPTNATNAPTSAPVAGTPTSSNLFFTIGPGKPPTPTNATIAAPVTSTPITINFPSFQAPQIGQPFNFVLAPSPNFFNPVATPVFQPGTFTVDFPTFNSQNTGFAQFQP
jgi:hypothetical protein